MTSPTRPAAPGASERLLVMGLLKGAWLAHACCALTELGVPDILGEHDRPVAEIAAEAGADTETLYRVLRALTTVDIVTELPGRSFALTAAGSLLRSDARGSLLPVVSMIRDEVMGLFDELTHTVRTGEPAFEKVYGKPFYDYLAANPERNRSMTSGLAASRRAPAMVATCRLDGARTVADIGGGNGALLAQLLTVQPQLHGILMELPEAARHARQVLTEAGVADRCEVVEGDFFTSVPAADAYVLARIVRNWDDERALALLSGIRRACHAGARLLLFEKVIPDEPVFHPAKIDDLLMLVLVRGRDRTESEHRELLGAAGFRVEEIRTAVTDLDAEAVIEAVAE
ncbi:methyltransferase [Streptantibioticus ferralitis]|uniref:Methyltransferase n=1 Tax=Streptantibioticus ferralitis TaxID=236510 RepID=A0ABT5Z237_9ACTN|nr:methyltransferase [Streptantibioticus ferralitis]MDF2257754.1 methyltransferase [Streptantibioticus ferralitis]